MSGVPSELKSLTGLRGVAACGVMVGHFTEQSARSGVVGRFLDHTYYAVDLFFVLSGFVLAMVYERSMRSPGVGKAYGHFLGHRIARIYPLYAITTLMSFLLIKAGVAIYGAPTSSALALLSNMLMMQFWGWPSDSLNGPGWSISVEWATNLLFPLLTFVMIRCSWVVSTSMAFAAAAFWLVSAHFATEQFWGTPIMFEWRWLKLPQPLFGCLVEFMFGMFCWRLRNETRWTSILGHPAVLWLIVVATAVFFMSNWSELLFIGSACLLVLGLSYETAMPSRILGTPILHRLGLISFSIYLVHAPAISLVPDLSEGINNLGVPHARTLADLLVMSLALGLSDLSYRFVERPLRHVLRMGFDRGGIRRA